MEIVIKIILVIGTITVVIGVIIALALIAFILKYSGNDELMNPDQDPPRKHQIN